MLNKAISIAQQALSKITDENGQPYVEHAFRVMEQMDTEEEKIAAVLHDVVEDAHITLSELEDAGFSQKVLEAIDQLTKRKDMTYFEYIDDIASSDLASKIKIAEINDNKDIFRVNQLSFKTYTLDERCRRSLGILKHTSNDNLRN